MINKVFGKKLGMTRYFLDEGVCVPVTIVKVEPCVVIQKKTSEKDGYEAVQIGFNPIKEKQINSPLRGHLKVAGGQWFSILKEIRVDDVSQFEVGQEILPDIFQIGDKVKISGISKGRGFSGVIKRWGFSGGRKTHGSRSHRVPGSIGQNTSPGRVHKGRKLPGRMGFQRVTIKNLRILDIRPDMNILALKGSIPGSVNNVIEISKS
ncbi:MAG: 50S ribosomal protein L3 [Deltaproteobacteria bacterium]|nr:50S ribosomal protein L3 [Deltaproteobacteria bacterium]